MVQDQALGVDPYTALEAQRREWRSSLYLSYGVAAAVGVEVGNSPGVVAGIRPALTSAGKVTLGLFISANVTPVSTFVRPMTGGSPFLTNS